MPVPISSLGIRTSLAETNNGGKLALSWRKKKNERKKKKKKKNRYISISKLMNQHFPSRKASRRSGPAVSPPGQPRAPRRVRSRGIGGAGRSGPSPGRLRGGAGRVGRPPLASTPVPAGGRTGLSCPFAGFGPARSRLLADPAEDARSPGRTVRDRAAGPALVRPPRTPAPGDSKAMPGRAARHGSPARQDRLLSRSEIKPDEGKQTRTDPSRHTRSCGMQAPESGSIPPSREIHAGNGAAAPRGQPRGDAPPSRPGGRRRDWDCREGNGHLSRFTARTGRG